MRRERVAGIAMGNMIENVNFQDPAPSVRELGHPPP